MNYMDAIFLRANLQQIRAFLLSGAEELRVDPRPYRERLESAEACVTVRLREKYPDTAEYDEILGLLCEYVGTVEDVYTEIGLQAGAILTAQVCQSLNTAWGEAVYEQSCRTGGPAASQQG